MKKMYFCTPLCTKFSKNGMKTCTNANNIYFVPTRALLNIDVLNLNHNSQLTIHHICLFSVGDFPDLLLASAASK